MALRSSIAVSPSAARSRGSSRSNTFPGRSGGSRSGRSVRAGTGAPALAPVQVDAGEDQLLAGNVDVVEATDEAGVSSGSGRSAGAVCA
jgi:hypothetical protein